MSNPEHIRERLAEAARYALLRRLAPAMRHNMAGSLQPLNMMAAMLEKRLQKPDPDISALCRNSATLNSLAREAGASCMGLMGWLAPRNNDTVAFDSCLEEAVGLVATELSFGGFNVVNNISGIPSRVPASVVRTVFMAALVALTDIGASPAILSLDATQAEGELRITMLLTAAEGEVLPGGGAPSYRELDWDDVEMLAAEESVSLRYTQDSAELRYRLS